MNDPKSGIHVTKDDLRAAVASGMITEAQAASITVLAQDRAGARAHMSGLDEPFELFKGFNEIFIIIGLSILYAGWAGLSGISLFTSSAPGPLAIVLGLISLVVCCGLAGYFTLKRRMIGPSILLTILFALSSLQTIFSATQVFGDFSNWTDPRTLAVCTGGAAVLLMGYFAIFRVPFTLALIMISAFASILGFASTGQANLAKPAELFLLSADGPFAFITLTLGLIGLIVAMYFDLSDPHRITRRASNAFWMHVLAAPAIVNTVALTLFTTHSQIALVALLIFIAVMACFAIIIDRRSFLISGVGYVVALAITITDGGFLIIFLLGGFLVFLGAKWEAIRRGLMSALPQFKGKDRLPPYKLTSDSPSA